MGEANASREASRIALRELRSTVKFSSLEGIDAAIKALESRQSHDSLSLSEEKRVIEEIARLKKSRASIGQLAEASQKLEAGDAQRGDMVSDLKSLDQRIDALKAREAELRSQLDGLRAKEGDKGDQYPALQQEEVDCREVCKAAYKKMVDLRAAHNEAWTAFKAANELYRAQTQADRKRQYEERQKARAEKDAYYAALRAEHAPEPFEEQIVAADQLASYIKGLDGSRRAEEGKEAGKPVAAAELPAGLKPLVKKDTDEKDAWMLGDGKSKRAAKGKRVGGAEARGADAGKLVHSLDILQAFAALGVDVPLTREAAVRGLGAVEAKKAEFLSMRQAAKAEAEAEAARKEAAGEAEGQDKKEGEAGEKEGEPDEKEENAEAQRRDEKKEKKPAAAKKPAQAPPRLDDCPSEDSSSVERSYIYSTGAGGALGALRRNGVRIESKLALRLEPRHLIILCCFLATLCAYVERVGFSIAFTGMAASAGVDERVKGAVMSAFYWGYALSQIPGGWAAQRWGGAVTLSFSFALWSAASLLTPRDARSALLMSAARVGVGVAQGFLIPAVHTVLSAWVIPAERARAVSLTTSGMYLGSALAMQTLPALGAALGYSSLPRLVGGLGLGWLALWRLVLFRAERSTAAQNIPVASQGRAAEASTAAKGRPAATPW
ncbi:hypothetical protein H632_c1215p0, partial [Helicosporidium sp. ATCC 50920]